MSAAAKITRIAVVHPTKLHSATLFFFHGSGSTGAEVKEWVDILNRGELKFPHIKIVYPTAPSQPYTPNGGMLSNVWFDRHDISINVPEIKESTDLGCKNALELIENEFKNGIPYHKMALAGFSMGGALALHLAYRYKPNLAGCAIMSSFLNFDSMVYEHLKASNLNSTPALLQFHGNNDEMVPIEWGRQTHQNLKQLRKSDNCTFVNLNDITHEISRTEINQLKEWLNQILREE